MDGILSGVVVREHNEASLRHCPAREQFYERKQKQLQGESSFFYQLLFPFRLYEL